MKKLVALFILPLWLVSIASPQSLAEMARKEKARRQSLKGKKVVLVTNADLDKVTKKPAVSSPETQESATAAKPAEKNTVAPTPPPRNLPPIVPPGTGVMSDKEYEARKAQLEEASKNADEMVDLLTTKLNSLWQAFYSLNDMTTKDKIKLQISDIYAKLVSAQDEANRANQELEKFLATAKREGTAKIWIK
jgi:hypothetical protein